MPQPPHRAYLAAFGTVAIWTGFILISRLGGKSVLTGWDILALRLGTASVLLCCRSPVGCRPALGATGGCGV